MNFKDFENYFLCANLFYTEASCSCNAPLLVVQSYQAKEMLATLVQLNLKTLTVFTCYRNMKHESKNEEFKKENCNKRT